MLDDTLVQPQPTAGEAPRVVARRQPVDGGAPRRRARRRTPGEQSAGQLLGVILAALALAALVNADAMVERAERKPLGPARDRALMIWHPVQDLAHVTQLHRIRQLADAITGDDDGGAGTDLAGAATAIEELPQPEEDAGPEVRPVLRTPTAEAPLRVYIGGDSVVRDAGESFLRFAAENPLLSTVLHYEIATGLSRPDHFDWPSTLVADAATHRPEVAILMFGGNDAQGIVTPDGQVLQDVTSREWRAEYGRRVAAVMDSLRAEDRVVLWVGQPPMRSSSFDARIDVINEVVAAAAAERPWVSFVDSAEVLGGPDGQYVDRLPGGDADLRQADGIHLSRAGADVLARHLLALVEAELAAASSASTTTTTAPDAG